VRAYLDHASTSPLRPVARAAMTEWLGSADPGRVHTEGRMARAALEDARASVASLFGTRPRQVIFTSGATEAINAAAYGVLGSVAAGAAASGVSGPSVAMGASVAVAGVEHSAVREASSRWASAVIALSVSGDGIIDLDHLRSVVASSGIGLVQCQLGNHEVGTLQPVTDVVEICRAAGVPVHIDAAAAGGHVEVEFDALGADLLSVSAHKFGGPAGIGALLVRRGLRIEPLILGGAQERARRGGLENVAAAVGFGAACEAVSGEAMGAEASAAVAHISRLRAGLLAVPGVVEYGGSPRLPHVLCVGIDGVEAEPVLIGLDRAGVAAHSGSSCSSEDLEPSPVLEAMGVDGERSLRLSVGWSTTDEEVDLAVEVFPEVVAGLRRLRGGGGG
jgi:cysteine desulfurase